MFPEPKSALGSPLVCGPGTRCNEMGIRLGKPETLLEGRRIHLDLVTCIFRGSIDGKGVWEMSGSLERYRAQERPNAKYQRIAGRGHQSPVTMRIWQDSPRNQK